jgi:hypothetical protein
VAIGTSAKSAGTVAKAATTTAAVAAGTARPQHSTLTDPITSSLFKNFVSA